MKKNTARNDRILALRGTMSFGLIARKLKISRSTVAGVCSRADRRAGITGRLGGWMASATETLPAGNPAHRRSA